MGDEKAHFIEIRFCDGSIKNTFSGRDFVPDVPDYEWPRFRVLGFNKDEVINEIIAKLNSLRI